MECNPDPKTLGAKKSMAVSKIIFTTLPTTTTKPRGGKEKSHSRGQSNNKIKIRGMVLRKEKPTDDGSQEE